MADQLKRDRLLIKEPRTSDEEQIEVLEQQIKAVNISNRLSRTIFADSRYSDKTLSELDESEHLSQLGDSTSLFSSVENSPDSFRQNKAARIEPRQPSVTSDNLFRTLGLHQDTLKARPARGKMAVEREPPKPVAFSPQKQNEHVYDRNNGERVKPAIFSTQSPNRSSLENIQQPQFGMVSPLQNRLQSIGFNIPKKNQNANELQSSHFNIPKQNQNGNELQSNVFNIPKRQQPRPEHHRPTTLPNSHLQGNDQARTVGDPAQSKQNIKITNNADFFEIPRPVNHPTWSTQRPVQPTFSSFVPVNVDTSSRIGNFIDLTSTVNQFKPDGAPYENFFGDVGPYDYVDIGKATENIKALLEGAFDDDEDKPRTRARKKKAEAAIPALIDNLRSTVTENEQKREEHHEKDDEEEYDDGSIEGLRIKLLPHQVDGVEWMRDKEVGTKKKNGVLPKGGILADDVRWLIGV